MTATKQRVPIAHAEAIANELVDILAPTCERIQIVGSIRRRRDMVADIELLVIPTIEVVSYDLFGAPTQTVNRFDEACKVLSGNGHLTDRLDRNGRGAWGPRYKRVRYHGFPVDLFSCMDPDTWGVLEMIRTGSAEFSRNNVTRKQMGGVLPNDMYVTESRLHRSFRDGTSEVIPTPTEESFFAAIDSPWIPPERRT